MDNSILQKGTKIYSQGFALHGEIVDHLGGGYYEIKFPAKGIRPTQHITQLTVIGDQINDSDRT